MKRRAMLAGAMIPLVRAHAADVKVDTLMQQAIGDLKNAQVYMQVIALPPGVKSGAHRHPGAVFGFVLEGTLELHVQGRAPQTLRQGEVFYEPEGVVHTGSRNPSSTGWTRFLAMVTGPVGKPAVLPAN